MTTILKATTKGQVTIPAKWRKQFNTDQFIATLKKDKLEIKPLIVKEDEKVVNEFTVFNAVRDNNGEGIEAGELLRILKEVS